MRSIFRLGCVVGAFFALSETAKALVIIDIDLSSQRMSVASDSGESYNWAISSARSGFYTPRGSYSPTSLQVMHRSRQYHNSPMPHSIFFAGGYAIHGTYETGSLGRAASHGCIRLSPGAAAKLFSMVKAEGASITITGSPGYGAYAHAHDRHDSAANVRHWRLNPEQIITGRVNPAQY